MAKPSSSVCNLDCDYCFYLEKEQLYPNRNNSWKMSDETVEIYIRQYIEAQSSEEVTFAWQGGEPTLLGLAFFHRVVALQEKYAKGKRIHNTIQTNGILLNQDWCLFLKKYNFLVGISIDGPKKMHDIYRTTRSGKATHDKVIKAISLLRHHQIEFNTLTVVSNKNALHGREIYTYLKSLGAVVQQYIPLIERADSFNNASSFTAFSSHLKMTPWSVSALDFGLFLSDIFDEWVKADVGQIFIPIFENILAAWSGEFAPMCTLSKQCGSAFALESNGDLYCCDHYVYPEYKIGNIHQATIKKMNQSQMNLTFGMQKTVTLTDECKRCDYLKLCYGGCPKHRFSIGKNGKPEHPYLCESYKKFFKHSESKMKLMSYFWKTGRSPADIIYMN